MIGVDLGKRSFQPRGIRKDGSAAFRGRVLRERFLAAVSKRGFRTVAMDPRQSRTPGPEPAADGLQGSPRSAGA